MSLTAAELRAVYVVDEGPLDRSLAGVPGKVNKIRPDGVKIDGDDRGFDRAATSAERRAGRLSQTMKSTVGAIAGYFAFDAVIGFIGDSISAASDLNQAISTSSVIFGDSSKEIDRWARGAWQSVGLSRRAATEAAIGFGDMFQQLGWTQDAAAGLSRETVQLAADLGAFRNLPTGDVVERLSAAFRGEYDSLQLLIPNISAARVETEALAATGKTSADQLTAQEKAAATLAIVQKDGARAAGAFAREANELSGSQQRLAARAENAKVKLGELLTGPLTTIANFLISTAVPAFEAVVTAIGWVVGAVAGLPGPVQAAGVAFMALTLLKGPLSSLFDTIALKALMAGDAIKGAATKAGGFKAAAGGLLGAINPLTAGLALAAAAFADYAADSAAVDARLKSARDAGEAFRTTLAEQGGQLNSTTREAAMLAAETAGLADVFDAAGLSSTTVTQALAGNKKAMDEARRAAEDADEQARRTGNTWGLMGLSMDLVSGKATENVDAFKEYAGILETTGGQVAQFTVTSTGGFGRAAQAVEGYGEATDGATASAEAQAEALDQLKSALDRFLGIAISTREAQLDVADGLADITERAKEYGTSLDGNTQAGRDNERAILDQITAMGDLAEATFRETGSADKAREAFNSQRDALRNTLIQMGYNLAEVDRLIGRYAQVPDSVYTDVQARTATATQNLRAVAEAVNSIPLFRQVLVTTIQRQVFETVGSVPLFGGLPRRAAGGPVWPGQTFLVGEQGPELVRFSGAGTVIPAAQSAQLMAAGNQQAAAGLTARPPAPASLPAPAERATAQPDGGRGALFHADRVTVIEGTPTDVARELALGARTRGTW